MASLPLGPAGPKGDPGSCVCDPQALFSTFAMPKTMSGPKGEPGNAGLEGKQGPVGRTVRQQRVYMYLQCNQRDEGKYKNIGIRQRNFFFFFKVHCPKRNYYIYEIVKVFARLFKAALPRKCA